MSADETVHWPAWLRDINTTLAVAPQYVLWGNVHDVHLLPDAGGSSTLAGTVDAIWRVLRGNGYSFLLTYDAVDGLGVWPNDPEHVAAAEKLAGISLSGKVRRLDFAALVDLTRKIAGAKDQRLAALISRPSRIVTDVSHLEASEHAWFVGVEKQASDSVAHRVADSDRSLHNPILWILDREQDLPFWLVADNDAIRTVVIPAPDRIERREMAELILGRVPGAADLAADSRSETAEALAELTDGMTLLELDGVTRLAADQGLGVSQLEDAVRAYRVGAADNPWRRDYLRQQVRDAEHSGAVSGRVLGQPAAVTKALDILKRSVLGLSGAQARSSTNRPRGVLLFVGPTGTGKTELAKALTELIFGEGTQPLRFDMSEFGAEHSEARLMGAPPGYVGYDAGGELTNSIRRRPFSVVLFDEIDKAHPRILDKFLQVLDEGRLTDGRGATVSFQESLLIFTSNAGMDDINADIVSKGGGQDALPSFEQLSARLIAAIQDFFVGQLKRPELLNRFGDNIVVFDFIREPALRRIFDSQIAFVTERVRDELGLALHFDEAVLDRIAGACTGNPLMGGRGIGNLVESLLVNPLGRALFALDPKEGDQVNVVGWDRSAGVASLELARS